MQSTANEFELARPADRAAFLDEVAKYYDETWAVDYSRVWHGNEVGALHYGWWDETTGNLKEALWRENEVLADRANITRPAQ